MNIDRTAMFAACVARGQAEGPGASQARMQGQGSDLQEQGSGLLRLPYPEQVCLDCWCGGAVEVACGLEQ